MATPKRPVRKVGAAGLSGGMATIVLWLVDDVGGLDVPTVVAAAITTVVAAGMGYVVRSAPGEPQPRRHP